MFVEIERDVEQGHSGEIILNTETISDIRVPEGYVGESIRVEITTLATEVGGPGARIITLRGWEAEQLLAVLESQLVRAEAIR